jgi:hypothetical protein
VKLSRRILLLVVTAFVAVMLVAGPASAGLIDPNPGDNGKNCKKVENPQNRRACKKHQQD